MINFFPKNLIIAGNNSNIIKTGKNSNVRLIQNIGSTGVTGTQICGLQGGSIVTCADGSTPMVNPTTGCVTCPGGLKVGSTVQCPGNEGPATVQPGGIFTCGAAPPAP